MDTVLSVRFVLQLCSLSFQGENWRDKFWESFEETPLYVAIWTYLGYGLLVLIGHIRDTLRNLGLETIKSCTEPKLPVSYFVIV